MPHGSAAILCTPMFVVFLCFISFDNWKEMMSPWRDKYSLPFWSDEHLLASQIYFYKIFLTLLWDSLCLQRRECALMLQCSSGKEL
jgi:hypothetical protein